MCSVFLGPSREVPEVLGNTGILGQGGVCSVQCLPGTIPGSTRGTRESRDTWTRGVCVVCSLLLGPSREVPEVLGNPGILGQGGVCSVQCLPGTIPGSTRGTRESRDTWTRGCMWCAVFLG